MDSHSVVDATRRWISAVVIGLNLCPFARRVFEAGRIRYAVSEATDEAGLLRDLTAELKTLAVVSDAEVETTLLLHPHVFGNFLDYNDFLDVAERRVRKLKLEGVIQIASFHPQYQFAETDPEAVENYTNRSPYPMLHLLREESVSEVAGDPDELLAIPRRNVDTLRALGIDRVREMLRSVH